MGSKAVARLRRSFIFVFLFPALRPGLRTVGPTGLARGKRGPIASFRRNQGVTWQFSTPGIVRETLRHKAFRVSRQKLVVASHSYRPVIPGRDARAWSSAIQHGRARLQSCRIVSTRKAALAAEVFLGHSPQD